MKKRSLFLTVIILAALLLTGCQCKHEWSEATCDTPKTCTLCGETEGEALGHDWRKATCEAPKTCARCGIEEGTTIAHDPGRPEYSEEDYVHGTAHAVKKCTMCKKVLEEYTQLLPSLHDEGKFLFTPEEFHQRITMIADELELPYVISFIYTRDPEGPMTCVINSPENDPLAAIAFSDMNSGQMYDRNIVHIITSLYDLEQSDFILQLLALTCDPSIQTYDQLASLGEAVSQTIFTGESYEKKGIYYSFGIAEENQFYILISAEKVK